MKFLSWKNINFQDSNKASLKLPRSTTDFWKMPFWGWGGSVYHSSKLTAREDLRNGKEAKEAVEEDSGHGNNGNPVLYPNHLSPREAVDRCRAPPYQFATSLPLCLKWSPPYESQGHLPAHSKGEKMATSTMEHEQCSKWCWSCHCL